MDESQLKTFVDIVQNSFEKSTGREAEMGTPFLGEPGDLPIHDFTGVIGISGSRLKPLIPSASRARQLQTWL